jgi:hypothetical protein
MKLKLYGAFFRNGTTCITNKFLDQITYATIYSTSSTPSFCVGGWPRVLSLPPGMTSFVGGCLGNFRGPYWAAAAAGCGGPPRGKKLNSQLQARGLVQDQGLSNHISA